MFFAGTARAGQRAWRFLVGRFPALPWLGLLCLAVFALYGQYLWNPIVFDDLGFFLLDTAGNLPINQMHLDPLLLRSLPNASLTWTVDAFGRSLIYLRLGNLLLHLAVVLSVYGCVQQLRGALARSVRRPVRPGAAAATPDRSVAFAAALLFALHPVAVYGAGYLVQRTIVMATLFSVLALWSFARGSTTGQVRWYWLCLPLYYLAVLSKEHAVALVLVLALLGMVLSPNWRASLRAARWPDWALVLALALVTLLVVLCKYGVLGSVYEVNADTLLEQNPLDHPYVSSVITQCWLFFKYLGLWLWPNPAWMSVDMREPLAADWSSYYGAGVAAYVVWGMLGLGLVLRRGRLGFVGLAMLFPWLLGWTELSTVRIQEPFVLYRSYLWMAGCVCMVAVLPTQTLGRKSLALLAVVAVVLFGLSMNRLQTFSHPVLLWDDAEKLVHGRTDRPGAARIYYNRGTELLKANQLTLAVDDLQQALLLQPRFPQAAANLGACYVAAEQWELAAASFSRAIELNGATGDASEGRYYLGRARAAEHLGEPEQVRADYQVACRIAGLGCNGH